MSREKPVVFEGPSGVPLFGILHEPERPRTPRSGVNLLNPGLKSRVAPNRLNVILARELATQGYFVLRFDPPGVGDSGGELPEAPLPELWQKVQRGAFVEATRLANHAFAAHCALDEIVGVGNCGGAITALLAAAGEPRVTRLVLLDVPVTIRDAEPGAGKKIRGGRQGSKVLAGYLRRARDWRAWSRLASGRSDLRTILQALRARWLDPARESLERRSGLGSLAEDEHLSELFVDGVTEFHARGGRMLFINAGNDDNTFVFDRLFGDERFQSGSEWADRHSLVIVPGANHIYGTPEWRAAVIGSVRSWLDPGPSATPRSGSVAIHAP